MTDKLKHIGHSLSSFCALECWASQRQAESSCRWFTSLRNLRVHCGSAVMLLETEIARDAENAEVAQRGVDGFLSC